MRKRFVGGLVLALTLGVPAIAPAHQAKVVARMARVAHLKAQVALDAPAAQARVNAAKAAGPAALKALVRQVISMPMPARNTTSPEQFALLEALRPETTVVASSGVAAADSGTARIASSCWYTGSHIWSSYSYYEAGVRTAYIEKDHGYWCGNGYSITDTGGSNWGYYHKQNASAPFCQVITFNQDGWDAPHSAWAHGAISSHYGSYTPWTSCVTWLGGTAAVRIAANGYWDTYYDF